MSICKAKSREYRAKSSVSRRVKKNTEPRSRQYRAV
jgi:hypothetical protein